KSGIPHRDLRSWGDTYGYFATGLPAGVSTTCIERGRATPVHSRTAADVAGTLCVSRDGPEAYTGDRAVKTRRCRTQRISRSSAVPPRSTIVRTEYPIEVRFVTLRQKRIEDSVVATCTSDPSSRRDLSYGGRKCCLLPAMYRPTFEY